jgi:hypothetical protein
MGQGDTAPGWPRATLLHAGDALKRSPGRARWSAPLAPKRYGGASAARSSYDRRLWAISYLQPWRTGQKP